MAAQNQQSVNTGATILIVVENQVIGRAQSLEANRSYGTEAVYEIGSIMPQEHVYNRYEGSITLRRYFVRTDTLMDLGLAGLGEDILEKGIVDVALFQKAGGSGTDGATGVHSQNAAQANSAYDTGGEKCIRVYRGCTAVSYSENIQLGAIGNETVTLQYLTCDDLQGNGGYLNTNTDYYPLGSVGKTSYEHSQIPGLGTAGGGSSSSGISGTAR